MFHVVQTTKSAYSKTSIKRICFDQIDHWTWKFKKINAWQKSDYFMFIWFAWHFASWLIMAPKKYAYLTCLKFTSWLKTGQNKLCAFDVLGFYFLIDENGLQTIIDFEYWTLEHLNTWTLEDLNTWTLEHLNTWTLNNLNTWRLQQFKTSTI